MTSSPARPTSPRSVSRFAFALLLGVGSALPVGVMAQQRGPAARVVSGKVTDKGSAPIRGAVVYLKDDHTLTVKSFISGDDGGFRFGQLSLSTDYEVWAENGGKKSSTRSVSSFDSKPEVQVVLKIDTGK